MTENEEFENDEIKVKEQTELGQVMENLDSDTVDQKTGLSTVDFNTRIKGYERGAILINDELQRLGIFTFLNTTPVNNTSSLTRPFKRLSISLEGQGRNEKVQLTQNQREHVSGGSFGERLKGLFTPQR
jgi:hypothetical protein